MSYFRPLVMDSAGEVEELQDTETLIADFAVIGASSAAGSETFRVVGACNLDGLSTTRTLIDGDLTYSSLGTPIALDLTLVNNSGVIPRSSRCVRLNITNNSTGFFNNPSRVWAVDATATNTSNTGASGPIEVYGCKFTAVGDDANYASSAYSRLRPVYGTVDSSSRASYINGTLGLIPNGVTCLESYGSRGWNSASFASGTHFGGHFVADGSGGTRYGLYGQGASGAVKVDSGLWLNNGSLVLGATSFSSSERLRVVGSSRFEGQSNSQDIVPISDSAYDLGTTGLRWRYGYFDDMKVGSININGSLSSITPSNGLTIGQAGGPVATLFLGDVENAYNTGDIGVDVKGGTLAIDTDANQDDGDKSFSVSHEATEKFSIRRVDAVNDGVCWTLGDYHVWFDSTGDMRRKSGVPTSDTDGVVVGTQS